MKNKYYDDFLMGDNNPIEDVFKSERDEKDLLRDCVMLGQNDELRRANRCINFLTAILLIQSVILIWMAV